MTFPAVKGCCFVVFWWGRKETQASGAIWLDEQFTVAHSQWSAHAPLPPFPLSQPLTTASKDRTPCSFSGHGTMGAWCRRRRTNTLHDSVTLSLWLIDNVGVLDNSDKLECHMFHCLSVCVGLCFITKCSMCEHAVSHFVRGLILCWMSVCHTCFPPSREPQLLLKAAAQHITPRLQLGCTLCSPAYKAKSICNSWNFCFIMKLQFWKTKPQITSNSS